MNGKNLLEIFTRNELFGTIFFTIICILVIIVNGEHKAKILKQVLDSPITNELPATILKLHPNCTLIADKDAASLLNLEDYKRL